MKWQVVILVILITSIPFIGKQSPVTAKTGPENITDSVMGRTLIVNAFDVSTMRARKNKKLLFYTLLDTLKYMIKAQMENNSRREIEIPALPFAGISQGDSIIYELQKQHKAAYAVVVKEYDVYFEQKDVEVQKDAYGTHRNASYDIYCVISYAYYDSTHLIKEARVSVFHYFSTRSVLSGFLAAGPNIVSNKDGAIGITGENVREYFRSYFPW